MQTFYIIIKKEYLTIYEKNGNTYERVYLGGNPEYAYCVNSAKDYADRCFEMLMEEYNLDTIGEMDLIVIDNEDDIISDAMLEAFGDNVKQRISVEKLILEILGRLGRDKKLRIPDYGINFDGKKYFIKDKKVVKEEFSLLSYTLKDEMLMKFIGQVKTDGL